MKTTMPSRKTLAPRGRKVSRSWVWATWIGALAVGAGLAAAPAKAQLPPMEPTLFPAAAMRLLDEELPRMEAAVRAGDGDYFEGATARVVAFSEDWDFKAHANPDLAPYRACTAAVSDYVVVGLCRLVPGSPACEPGLAADFARNVAQCRQAAAR